jgi:hypothetical protein
MSTGSIVFYDSFSTEISGSIDLSADAFVVIPLSSSYTPNVATHTRVSDLTGEVTTNGGQRIVLQNTTWADVGSGIGEFDADDIVWTQSGGSDLVIHYFAIADNTPAADANKQLICYGLLDITAGGTDVTAPAGGSPANTITGTWNANGIFRHTMTDA